MSNKNNHSNISKNYKLSSEEENKSIDYINQMLNEFKSQLDLISIETTFYSIIPLGRKISESLLELLLKKEGYSFLEYCTFMQLIRFSFENKIITQNIYKTLNSIRQLGNKALHGDEIKSNDCLFFLNSFSEFITWFNSTYNRKLYSIEETVLKINSTLKTTPTLKTIKKPQIPSNYKFYKKEESEEIYEINKLLNDYTNQLKLISSEKKFYFAFLGSTITELMLKLLIKKEGYINPNVNYTIYQYCKILDLHKIIPKECYNFLLLIRNYRNEFVHGTEQSDKLLLSFLKAFNYFIQWFDSYYSQNYQNKFQIEECCELIDSIIYDETNNMLKVIEIKKESRIQYDNRLKLEESKTNRDIIHIKNRIKNLEKEMNKKEDVIIEKSLTSEQKNLDDTEYTILHSQEFKFIIPYDDEIKYLNEELIIKEKEHQKQIEKLTKITENLLKKLNEQGKQLEKCLSISIENKEYIEQASSKIDDLHLKIDKISNQINTIQSLTERQINNAQSTEEIERIIETYVDECANNIMTYSMNFKENENYKKEKNKLIYSIGKDSWDKLCEKSKAFLITSKVMYNHLITIDDIIDYSGICVLVTKALEVEIHKRFFTNFLNFLTMKYGKDYKKYPTSVLYQKRKPLLSEKFTMGKIAFVMCYIENRKDSDEEKINNKLRLMEYCKECIFSNKSEEEIEILLTNYASSIEKIREEYRNPSAHTNEIKRVDAEECFNLVLDIEKLLKKMLDSFDY